MPVKKVLDGRVPVKIYTDKVDNASLIQLANLAELPIIHSHIAAMPDVHCGIGATVGSVIPTKRAIIPAAVGVDIGCGMIAVKLSLHASQLPDNLRRLRLAIEESIPVGFNAHSEANSLYTACKRFEPKLNYLMETHPHLLSYSKNLTTKWITQMGTLGGGNHFIELCLDENLQLWVMLHSGSRGIGNAIGSYFIDLAKKDMAQHFCNLPDKNLAYFTEGSKNFTAYYHAVEWAQEYALTNREEMLKLVLQVLAKHLPPFTLQNSAINCHHNYVAEEFHFGEKVYITRKGAIRAQQGELGIIPGSMGACSYIVRGKGVNDAFHSCSHGAGRSMSREQAKRKFKSKDLIKQTKGVECRKDRGVLDEIPAAYKNIDEVMRHQSDLVEVVYRLKQIVCIKG